MSSQAYADLLGFCVHSLTGDPLHVQGGTAGPDPNLQNKHSTIIGSTNNVTSSLKTQLRIFRAVERFSIPSILLIHWVLVGYCYIMKTYCTQILPSYCTQILPLRFCDDEDWELKGPSAGVVWMVCCMVEQWCHVNLDTCYEEQKLDTVSGNQCLALKNVGIPNVSLSGDALPVPICPLYYIFMSLILITIQ